MGVGVWGGLLVQAVEKGGVVGEGFGRVVWCGVLEREEGAGDD